MGYAATFTPAALFALDARDVVFPMRKTPASERMLLELPQYYDPIRQFPIGGPPGASSITDAPSELPIVPVSKYATGTITVPEARVSRKRSRAEHEDDPEEVEIEGEPVEKSRRTADVPPAQNDVALFNPEHKHIRDRIHAGHAFRPPSEHPMPPQSFFECRHPSQWTVAEEDELRTLVKECSYNWSLIADILSSKSRYSSGAERRTPWECFECWVSLEGLPADMQKTQYFRTYHGRLEAAQRSSMPQQQPPPPQSAQTDGSTASTPVRRRSTQPIRVERRKQSRHLALIDAMRKLAKQRETAAQKQQHGEFYSPRSLILMAWAYRFSLLLPYYVLTLSSSSSSRERRRSTQSQRRCFSASNSLPHTSRV